MKTNNQLYIYFTNFYLCSYLPNLRSNQDQKLDITMLVGKVIMELCNGVWCVVRVCNGK